MPTKRSFLKVGLNGSSVSIIIIRKNLSIQRIWRQDLIRFIQSTRDPDRFTTRFRKSNLCRISYTTDQSKTAFQLFPNCAMGLKTTNGDLT